MGATDDLGYGDSCGTGGLVESTAPLRRLQFFMERRNSDVTYFP